MRIVLPDERGGWCLLPRRGVRGSHRQPARRASSRRRTFCIAGSPPRIM
jgi:hypothetical protein